MKLPSLVCIGIIAFTVFAANTYGAIPYAHPQIKLNATDMSGRYAIPITISPEGHIFLKVKVDNVEGNFVLDTGAGINVITRKFAGKISGIREEDGCFTGFRATGEAMRLRLYKVNDLKVGDLDIHDPTISILNADLGSIDGLISLTCFRNQPFTIDFADKKIYLETRKSLERRIKEGKSVPIQLDDDRGISLDMFMKVRVDNKLKLQISLDSGAGFNVYRFNAGFMKELGIDTSSAEKVFKKSTLNKSITNMFYVSRLDRISVSAAPSVNVEKVKAAFLPQLIYDGITGINWLGKRITIDIPDRIVIVD